MIQPLISDYFIDRNEALNQPITFNVVLGFAGGANPASVGAVEFDLADVGTETPGQGAVGDAGQLDVVDVSVAIRTDVSRRLMVAERRTKTRVNRPTLVEN